MALKIGPGFTPLVDSAIEAEAPPPAAPAQPQAPLDGVAEPRSPPKLDGRAGADGVRTPEAVSERLRAVEKTVESLVRSHANEGPRLARAVAYQLDIHSRGEWNAVREALDKLGFPIDKLIAATHPEDWPVRRCLAEKVIG